ncbi:MAG: DUF1616 domain-containing protein [Actinomycetota bacterium]|nr:DUF1616 domain-containing protein [Actinomycetota bacterium]
MSTPAAGQADGPGGSRQDGARKLLTHSAAIVVLSAATAITVATGWHSPVRTMLAICFLLFVPGSAVVELLQIDDVAYRLTVATGVSLAVDTAVSLALVYAHAFSLALALAILIALCFAALGSAAVRLRHGHGSSGGGPVR